MSNSNQNQPTIMQQSAGVVHAMRTIQSEVREQSRQADTTGAQFDSAVAMGSVAKRFLGGGSDDLGFQSDGYLALQKLFDHLGDEAGYVMDSAVRTMDAWKRKFGQEIGDNVLYAGISRALSVFESTSNDPVLHGAIQAGKSQMDSAANMHHDQLSIRAGLAIASLLSTMTGATPFTGVVPFPMGSNEGKIVLITPVAANSFGAYREGDVLVGARAGKPFAMADRIMVNTEATVTGGKSYTVAITECVDKDPDNGGWIPTADSPAERILAGRTMVLVNGQEVATDVRVQGTAKAQNQGTTSLAGKFYLPSDATTQYTVDGTCNVDTGVIAYTIKPALPDGTSVRTYAIIDWERQNSRTSGIEKWGSVGVETDNYSVYAVEARLDGKYTISSATQFQQELGMSIAALSMGANDIYNQERMYRIIQLGAEIAKGNPQPILALNVSEQMLQKTFSQSISDQIMMRIEQVETEFVTEAWSTKAGFVFIPPTLAPIFRRIEGCVINTAATDIKAGIYLVCTLPNGLQVYSIPQMEYVFGDDETAETGSILICGSDMGDPARSPIIIGDAIPFLPINMMSQYDRDFIAAQGWYGRGVTRLNPHAVLAGTWARIDITGLNMS